MFFHLFCKDKIDGFCINFDSGYLMNNSLWRGKHFVNVKGTCCRLYRYNLGRNVAL